MSYEEKYPNMSDSERSSLFRDEEEEEPTLAHRMARKSWSEIAKTNVINFDFENIMHRRTKRRYLYTLTIFNALCGATWIGAMIWGCGLTTQSHVFILTNLHGLFSFILVICFRGNLSSKEKNLMMVVIVGLMCLIFDPYSYRVDMVNKHGHHKNAFAVDFMLILSNIPAILYFSFNKMLMKDRIIPHLFFVNLFMMIIFIIMAVLYDNA